MTFQESFGLIKTAIIPCNNGDLTVYTTKSIAMEILHNKNFKKLFDKLLLGFLRDDNFGEIDEHDMKYNMAHKDLALGNYPVKNLQEKYIWIKRDYNIMTVFFPSEY